MENYLCAHTDFAERAEKMYPEAFNRVFPHVMFLVDCLCDENLGEMTDEQIEKLTGDVMRRSGVMDDPPAGHTPGTMRDMTRSFVVREIRDAHRRRRSPLFPPFFFLPYGNMPLGSLPFGSPLFDGGFDGFRDDMNGFRDRMNDFRDDPDGFRDGRDGMDGFRDGEFNYDFDSDMHWNGRI